MELKLVDGCGIRNNVDVDFCGVGSRYFYDYIPDGELWLDDVLAGESDFFVRSHHFELELWKSGLSRDEVRSKLYEKFATKRLVKPDVVLGIYPNSSNRKDVRVFIVNGRMVRKYYDPAFIQGGHDLVYDYIPKNTVWLEKAFEKEHRFIFVHEIYERECMRKNGRDYSSAHELACNVEKIERKKFVDRKSLRL
jgi:hypothetical protein